MVGWNHWLNGHEFGHTLGDGEGQGNLVCCSPWGQTQRVRYNLVTEQQHSDVLIFQIDSFSSFLRQKPKRFFWYLPWESCCAPGDIVPFPLPWLGPSAVFSSQNCACWASTISSVIVQVSPPPALARRVFSPHESVPVSCDSLELPGFLSSLRAVNPVPSCV